MAKKIKQKPYKGDCRVEGCGREIQHAGAQMCNRCYSFANYWRNRTPTEKMKRMDLLDFWAKRAHSELLPQNVVMYKGGKT